MKTPNFNKKDSRPAQNFIITLSEIEFAPLLFFLDQISLPAELDDKWSSGLGTIKCSICMPLDVEPAILMQMWNEWKKEGLAMDYAPLN